MQISLLRLHFVNDTRPFTIPNLVKHGTALGPILNNCSLGDISDKSQYDQYGEVKISPPEFVDDIADINDGVSCCFRQQYDLSFSGPQAFEICS